MGKTYDFCFDNFTLADSLSISLAMQIMQIFSIIGIQMLLPILQKFTDVHVNELPLHELQPFVTQFFEQHNEYMNERVLINEDNDHAR